MRQAILQGTELAEGQWQLSLVLARNGGHAYVVVEGFDAQGTRVAQEAHFGYRYDDHRYGMIDTMAVNYARLNGIATYCKMDSWIISTAEKDRLLAFVTAQKQHYDTHNLPYVRFGPSTSAGSVGKSLDMSGSTEVKRAGIRQAEEKLYGDAPTSWPTFFNVQLSMLQNDENTQNCFGWARKAVVHTIGDRYVPKKWEQLSGLVAVDPKARFTHCAII